MLVSTIPIPNNKIKNTFEVKSLFSDGQAISQTPDSISIHKVDKKFLVITSEVGYFNKLTKFIVGNEKSILFLDNKGEQCCPSIEEVIKKAKKYFLIYPLPCNINKATHNYSIELSTKKTAFKQVRKEDENIILDFEQGQKVGKTFFNYKSYNSGRFLTNFEQAINGCEDDTNFWPNKNFIINSNVEFCLGVILGYFEASRDFIQEDDIKETLYLHKNDNIYAFATILNWLGAGYVIINLKKELTNGNQVFDKKIMINLPRTFSDLFNIITSNEEFSGYKKYKCLFRDYDWLFSNNGQLQKTNENKFKTITQDNEYNQSILKGDFILIPATSIKFQKYNEDEELFDMTMPLIDATNYALPFTPMMKNSDGDILTLSTVFGKEAIKDAEPFEPNRKEWFRNLNDGNINQWISDDAILGLYAVTKYL